jgi:hyperosmotically inducible periplasmic protein
MDQSRRRAIAAAMAALALAGLAGCASKAPQEQKSSGIPEDAATTARVKTAIATEAGARTAGTVNVDTFRGVVQLTGFVDTEEQSRRAVEAAKKVAGVRSVKNDLRVK